MNTIKQTINVMKKSTTSFKIPVKIGSNSIYVGINRETKSIDLIKSTLLYLATKTKATKPVEIDSAKLKSYVLFERARGIDRLLSSEQNIFELWLQWNMHNKDKIEFVVKLCKQSKRRPKTVVRNQQVSSKLFEMGRAIAKASTNTPIKPNKINTDNSTHFYEKVVGESEKMGIECGLDKHIYENITVVNEMISIETAKEMDCWKTSKLYLKKILKNEKKLHMQNKKLVKLDSSIVNHVKRVKKAIDELNFNNNINFDDEFTIDVDQKFSILTNMFVLDSNV